MVRTYKKVKKSYTEETIKTAVQEVAAGASIRATSKKYLLSFSLLRERCQAAKETKETETTREEILHSRGRSGTAPPKARRKINTHGEIITQKQCIEQIKMTDAQKPKSETKEKEKRPRKAVKRRKQPASDIDSTTSTEDEIDVGHSSDDLSLGLNTDKDTEDEQEQQKAQNLEKLPKPKLSEESVGKYYAVYYTEPHLT